MSRVCFVAAILAGCISEPPPPAGCAPQPVELGLTDPLFDPFLTGDHAELFFTRTLGGNGQLWFASRPSSDVPFDPPGPVLDLMSTGHDDTASMLSDQNRQLWFVRDSTLWHASRPDRQHAFAGAAQVPGFDDQHLGAKITAATLTGDELTMFFALDDGNIYVVSRSTNDVDFDVATKTGVAVASSTGDRAPSISSDGYTLLFQRFQLDGHHIMRALHGPTSFTVAAEVTELGHITNTDDLSPQFVPDFRTIAFSSNRGGTYQLYLYCE